MAFSQITGNQPPVLILYKPNERKGCSMRKRICAAALAVTLALLFAVPPTVASSPPLYGDSGNKDKLNISGFSTLIDVSYQVSGRHKADPSSETVQYYKSYAVTENGKEALRWKEIKAADLTIWLEWDISKIIRKPGRLILSSAEAAKNTAKSVSECLDADADGDIGYAVYTITGAAPNPAAIPSSRIIYSNADAFIDIGADSEWSKDGHTWYPASNNGPNGEDTASKWCGVRLSSARQTIYVRGRASADDASNITLPSQKSVRVNIPAMPKAPKVRIYASQALLSARAGLEISNDGYTWALMTENTLPLGVVTNLPASGGTGTVPIDLGDKSDVYIRVPAGNGRPHSEAFETNIRISDTGAVTDEDFSVAPKQVILVDNAVVIEAFMGNKWRKVKKISASDIPETGLKVRRAGTKERLPGPERVLRLISFGGYKIISVTET